MTTKFVEVSITEGLAIEEAINKRSMDESQQDSKDPLRIELIGEPAAKHTVMGGRKRKRGQPTVGKLTKRRKTNRAPGLPKKPFRCMIVAPSGSGKTNLLMNLLGDRMYGDDFNEIFIFSNSLLSDPVWKTLSPKHLKNSYNFFDAGIVEQKYHEQKSKIEENNGVKDDSNSMLLVFDDCIENIKHVGGGVPILDFLSTRGRHQNISFIIVSQRYKWIPKTIRVQCNLAFVFKLVNQSELKDFVEEYGGLMNKKSFFNMLNHVWRLKFHFLMIDNDMPDELRFRRNMNRFIHFNPELQA